MKINIEYNSKPGCCSGDQVNIEGSAGRYTKKCRNRALLYLSLGGIVFLLAFALGYTIPSFIIRIIWLIISGTLLILSAISMVVLVQCTNHGINEQPNSVESK